MQGDGRAGSGPRGFSTQRGAGIAAGSAPARGAIIPVNIFVFKDICVFPHVVKDPFKQRVVSLLQCKVFVYTSCTDCVGVTFRSRFAGRLSPSGFKDSTSYFHTAWVETVVM